MNQNPSFAQEFRHLKKSVLLVLLSKGELMDRSPSMKNPETIRGQNR